MNIPTSSSAPVASKPIHWPSVLQFGLIALVILGLSGTAFLMALFGLAGVFLRGSSGIQPLTMMLTAAGFLAASVILLPGAFYPLWRLMGKAAPDIRPFLRKLRPGLWIWLVPVVILLGQGGLWLAPSLSWLFLPPLHILAVLIPIIWMSYLTVRKLPLGSPQRMWGLLSSGLGLASPLIMVIEGIAILVCVVMAVIYFAVRPELAQELFYLVQELQFINPTPEQATQILGPYLLSPGVILSILAFTAVVVPLIEEFFKPAGVLLLVGRKISPQAGFVAGALSGAGFAMFESLMVTSNGESWAMMVVGRVGTASVHILTAALTGWALVQTWQKGRYLPLAVMYALAVTIHGLWNGLTVLSSFAILSRTPGLQAYTQVQPYLEMGLGGPLALVFLAISLFILLLFANRELSKKLPASLQTAVPAQPLSQPVPPAAASQSSSPGDPSNDGMDQVSD